MYWKTTYLSPVGELTLAEKDGCLAGLWIKGQKYYLASLDEDDVSVGDTPTLAKAKSWLDEYFAGRRPSILALPLAPRGTDFQRCVWQLLCHIPYGQTKTYGQIAEEAAALRGIPSSARAVGTAVGHNPISIIIPCHRVVGAKGRLTGYAGGLDKKIQLLAHEGADMARLCR